MLKHILIIAICLFGAFQAVHQCTRSETSIPLIPADAGFEERIDALQLGKFVSPEAQLVAATTPGWLWRSSLSRDDAGSGAFAWWCMQEFEIS